MTSKRQLIRQQRRWAASTDLAPDAAGYLETYEQNLYRPLSAKALAAFDRGCGSELRDARRRPAKMRALYSSAALAVNVFDYWSERDAGPLLEALGLDAPLASLDFERQFPTALAGITPILDVTLELLPDNIVGIESKFTEWLTRKRKARQAFKDKYFDDGKKLWATAGLPRCQSLASDMQKGAEHFKALDAGQLLKHALGLATQRRDRFSLCYAYFDIPCPASKVHRHEIERFASRVGEETRFQAICYQDLFRVLRATSPVDTSYVTYLGSRYFPN